MGNFDIFIPLYIFPMKNLLLKILKNKILLISLSLCAFIVAILFMYHLLSRTIIYAQFDKLRPFHEKAPVYFRGYKIGKVIKIQPTDNYQNTLVAMVLYPKDLQLPVNTVAQLKVHKTRWMHRDYIDLIYPSEAENQTLKRGAKIQGKSSIDIHSYLSSISHESFEKMEENAAGILENLNDTTGMLYSVFALINGILTESDSDIKNVFNNLSQTTKDTKEMIKKIDNSISEVQLKNSLNNLYETTTHTKNAVYNIMTSSSQLDKTIYNTNCLLNNINEIACGVKNTMRKRFSGIRLFFGKVIY